MYRVSDFFSFLKKLRSQTPWTQLIKVEWHWVTLISNINQHSVQHRSTLITIHQLWLTHNALLCIIWASLLAKKLRKYYMKTMIIIGFNGFLTMGMSSLLVQSLRPRRQLLTLCWGFRRSHLGQAPGHTASSSAQRATPSDHAVVRLAIRNVGSCSVAHSSNSARFVLSERKER